MKILREVINASKSNDNEFDDEVFDIVQTMRDDLQEDMFDRRSRHIWLLEYLGATLGYDREDQEILISQVEDLLSDPEVIDYHKHFLSEDINSQFDRSDSVYSAQQSDQDEELSQYEDQYLDDIQEINQEFTSENTSINSTKLPAIFKMVSFEPDTINLDMGGGKFDNATEYLSEYDVTNLIYDPYNRSKAHNSKVIKTLKSAGGADTATCSNVLNVIKEPEARIGVLKNMSKLVKPGGDIYITVYEGRGDSNEGRTKSGYQLNRKTADYLDEIQEVFPDARRRGKLITATNSGSVSSSTSIGASSSDSAYYDTSAILDKLRFDVTDIVDEIVRNYLGYDGADANTSDYYVVEVTKDDHTYARIEVRAEVDYEGLEDLDEALNEYVTKFDSDAYFEPVDPGITECYINWRKVAAALG